MEQSEENTLSNPQALFLKYFIESLRKQHVQASEFSPILTEQSTQRNTNPMSSKKCYQSDTSSTDCNQDETYRERRKKNNEAAKRSRDARRVKEDQIALRATWLEQENVQLRLENVHLKQENAQLRCQLSSSIDL